MLKHYDMQDNAISIHALRVEGDYVGSAMYTANLISIHALRVEGDLKYCRKVLDGTVFLSTPSGWRATRHIRRVNIACKRFLSTPSGWRATAVEREKDKVVWYFYPRPPGGGRPSSKGFYF